MMPAPITAILGWVMSLLDSSWRLGRIGFPLAPHATSPGTRTVSADEHAAVDVDDGSGDEGVGHQEERGLGHVLGAADATGGDGAAVAGEHVLAHVLGHAGIGRGV